MIIIFFFFWLKFDMSTGKGVFCVFKQLGCISVDNFHLFLADFTRNQAKMLLFLLENTRVLSYPDIQLLSPLKPLVAYRKEHTWFIIS